MRIKCTLQWARPLQAGPITLFFFFFGYNCYTWFGLYVCARALAVSLRKVHLFLHDYSGSTIRPRGALNNATLAGNISLNASIVDSVLVASRLPWRLHVFVIMFFSLKVFLFAPLITFCMKKYSLKLHLCFSFALMSMTVIIVFRLHRILFVLLLCLLLLYQLFAPTGLYGYRNTSLR